MTGNGVRERGDDDLQQVGFEPWAAAARTQPLRPRLALPTSQHAPIYLFHRERLDNFPGSKNSLGFETCGFHLTAALNNNEDASI